MANLFDLKLVRKCQWRQMDDGRVVVLVPRFRGRWLGRWLMSRLKKPYFQIKLDQFGSWVWLQCDGSQTVEDIALSLRERFGEAAEPAYERLALFVKQLMGGGLLEKSPGKGERQ